MINGNDRSYDRSMQQKFHCLMYESVDFFVWENEEATLTSAFIVFM